MAFSAPDAVGIGRVNLLTVRATAPPRKNQSWKLEVGTFGEYFRRKKNPPTARILCHCVLLFKRRLEHGCQGLGLLTSNFDLCTGAG